MDAERDGAYRAAKRIHAVILNSDARSSGEIAHLLKAPRSRVSEWLANYETYGLEGFRFGRPALLSAAQLGDLTGIVDSGPVAYVCDCGVWTSPMIARVITERFGLGYHPGHVRKLLHRIGFSVQRPRRVLARADAAQKERWQRKIFPNLKKKRKPTTGR